jgi:hypothetical protein
LEQKRYLGEEHLPKEDSVLLMCQGVLDNQIRENQQLHATQE